ncbi:MAG: immunity protein 31 [Gammaproteobacteria bacterium]|nr:immunity protein 31 [Gammaproteobacteria bacterium]
MSRQYDFYDVVNIATSCPKLDGINGLQGAIVGAAENDAGEWVYSVYIFESEECWEVMEAELSSTGKKMAREDFYDGESIKVIVDPVTGEGKRKK